MSTRHSGARAKRANPESRDTLDTQHLDSGSTASRCPGMTTQLHRLQQDVLLPAERKFNHAFRREVLRRQRHLLVGNRCVIDLEAAGLDLPARFAAVSY